ncbi:PD40 domain-containing protein [Paenibacillus sp. FSL H7-0326]|uniref:PD40 domain-containing protein n=1 Tax=Paenibacillus sp. FSL H7-0326 TaxID=1921144 RepID=UPI001180C92A|nr:PD40 domain-containing protein [Paenibacillus sp. FSL H7-0326]
MQAGSQDIEKGWIAYTSNRGGSYDIWLYQLNGGLNSRITDGMGMEFSVPYWAPDNSKIAFIGVNNVVFVLDIATRAIARIDQIEPYTLLDWSPDSRSLVYVKNGRIMIYDTFTHRSYFLLEVGARDAQWFPSGKELIFAAPDINGNTQIYRIRTDGSNRRQITRNTGGPLHQLRISPDGKFALYTFPGASISLISVVNLETGATNTLAGGSLSKNYFPAWSPDSQNIAYSATEFKEPTYYSHIQIDSFMGNHQRTITISNCFSTPVDWSPDGKKIAYLSGCTNAERASQLWIVDISEQRPVYLLNGGQMTALQWSPKIRRPPHYTFTSFIYMVSFPYPANWSQVSEERYEGPDGFFQVSAISGSEDISDVCSSEAYHPLMPYGSSPMVIQTSIQHQDACFIYPSADQPPEMNQQAALIVRYPRPVQIGGTYYNYFILYADVNHIRSIGGRLTFIQ